MRLLKKILILSGLFVFLSWAALELSFHWFSLQEPTVDPAKENTENQSISNLDNSGGQFYQQNDFGIWEAYVEGSPFERGVALGEMTKRRCAVRRSISLLR